MGEYEASGDELFTKHGINDTKEAFKFYEKALSAAEERGLLGKVPPLLLKMAKCHRRLSETETEVTAKLAYIRFSSRNLCKALFANHFNDDQSSQGDEWIKSAVREASTIEQFFFNTLLEQVEEASQKLEQAVRFPMNSFMVNLANHPFLPVSISVHKQVAFMALDRAQEVLREMDLDHQRARQVLQILQTALDKANTSYDYQEENDAKLTRELTIISEDYLTSCDAADAIEALEAGKLITTLATEAMDTNNVEDALNHGWDALDKFKEAERLTEAFNDDICYSSKCSQGFLFKSIFKMPVKAEQIYTLIVESSASQYHKEKEWFKEAKTQLAEIKGNNPAVKKDKLLEELKPDLERMNRAVKEDN